jgi:hypothetical protein
MLHEQSKQRIKENGINGESLANVLEEMANEASENDIPALDTIVIFLEDGDEFTVGSYVPEIHLIVRRVDESDIT